MLGMPWKRKNPRYGGDSEVGRTEYYANRALGRFHIIPPADFLKLAAYHLGHYAYFRSAPAFAPLKRRVAASKT